MTKILFLESYYSGSHKFFLNQIKTHTKHSIDILTISDMGWRLNFERSALYFYSKIENINNYDIIVATTMTDISSFKSFYKNIPPIILYWHENQFAYPGNKNRYLGLRDIQNYFTADFNLFNSNFHKNDFLTKFNSYLNDFNLSFDSKYLKNKYNNIDIVYPGFDLDALFQFEQKRDNQIPVFLWNHRWSKDKDYSTLFSAMRYLKRRDYKFKLNILGERVYQSNPDFENFKKQLKDNIINFGYLDSKDDYYKAVWNSDFIISTALEENFGISVVESMAAGLTPIFPNRLSYPELIPEKYHSKILFNNYDQFTNSLVNLIKEFPKSKIDFSEVMKKYDIKISAEKFDKIIEEI